MCFLYPSVACVGKAHSFMKSIMTKAVKYLIWGFPKILGNRERNQCGGAEEVWSRQPDHHFLVSRKLNHSPQLNSLFCKVEFPKDFAGQTLGSSAYGYYSGLWFTASGLWFPSWLMKSLQKLNNDSGTDHF